MLKDKRFCFAGNRFFVLEEMLEQGLNIVEIFVVKDSYLERVLLEKGIPFSIIEGKKSLITQLRNCSFDYFVSNGLPYILPISELSEGGHKAFINIHPSKLPDLRGINPVNGSLLYGRDAGATCHYMNDKIDDGDIIAQVGIPFSDDLDAALLYRLSFGAERAAFKKALMSGFMSARKQELTDDCVYYSVKEEDKVILFSSSAEEICRQVKAFNAGSTAGAYFVLGGERYTVRFAQILTNAYLLEVAADRQENDVVFVYDDTLILKKKDCCLKLIVWQLFSPGAIEMLAREGVTTPT